MHIAIASDHGGYALKCTVKAHLLQLGHQVTDFGEAAARAVAAGDCSRGIVICTTGIGISMAANKVGGIRCAHCADTVEARLTREHNDANMLAIGAGFTGELLALEMVDVFLATPFSEGERHARRVAKVNAIRP